MQIPTRLFLGGGVVLVFSVLMKFLLFDEIVKLGIKNQVSLKRKNELRGFYLKVPFPLNFSVYFFNVSNPSEVQNGAKPKLKEIGPYVYDEFVEKVDVQDNDAEDSLIYSPYHVFQFNEEKSASLSEDDYVTIIHPLIVGMVNQVSRDFPAFLSIVNKAIMEIFHPDTFYLTEKVRNILFDGIEINCKPKDFAAKAVCTQMKQQIPGLQPGSDNQTFLFSLFGSRNATKGKRVKVLKGTANFHDVGRVLEIDGAKKLNIWSTEECNRYRGTDGWIFPPMLNQEEGLMSYSSDLCRSIKAEYINDSTYKNLNVRRYEGRLGDMSKNLEEKCYCFTKETCTKKGIFDLSKCLGVPLYATLPHFLDVEESYLEKVEGLKPVLEDHILKVLFEPMTSTPVQVRKRMQLNIQLKANEKIDLMKNAPEALHPIFWLEESLDLDGDLLKKVSSVFLLLKVTGILLYMSMFFGMGLVLIGVYYYNSNRKGIKITQIDTVDKEENGMTTNGSKPSKVISTLQNSGHVNHAMSGREFDRY